MVGRAKSSYGTLGKLLEHSAWAIAQSNFDGASQTMNNFLINHFFLIL